MRAKSLALLGPLLRRRRTVLTGRLARLAFAVVAALSVGSLCSADPVYSDLVIQGTAPVLYWDLSETSGTTAGDLADTVPTPPPAGLVPANDGTYAGQSGHPVGLGDPGPRPTDGYLTMGAANTAAHLDRRNTVAYAPNLTPTGVGLNSGAGVGTDAYSIQTWFNSEILFTSVALQYVFCRGGSNVNADRRDSVYIGGTYTGVVPNKLHLLVQSASAPAAKAVGDTLLAKDTWYHLVYVRDGDNAKAYLNGKLEASLDQPWGGGAGEYFTAGHRTDYTTDGNGVDGHIDEVAVWDRPLNATEVYRLYTQAFRDCSIITESCA